MQQNPTQIQKVSRRFKAATPLFLFHDGGGTILPYTLFGELNRSVWAISNPHLHDGGEFEGGIEEMGSQYAGLVRNTIGKGGVILGGWSAGGSVALQVARCLENVPGIEVIGLIMIDTPYPAYPDWRPEDSNPVRFTLPHQPGQSKSSRIAQQLATDSVIKALAKWRLPTWNDTRSGKPPPTVFIRALQLVCGDAVHEVDWFRKEPVLGWHRYSLDFIVKELPVEGNHFSIFTAGHLAHLEEVILESCKLLEGQASQQNLGLKAWAPGITV